MCGRRVTDLKQTQSLTRDAAKTFSSCGGTDLEPNNNDPQPPSS